MMNDEMKKWVSEEMGELYWKFRDDLDDEGGKRLAEEIEYFEGTLVKIIEKHITA